MIEIKKKIIVNKSNYVEVEYRGRFPAQLLSHKGAKISLQ